MSQNQGQKPATPSAEKAARDNRANQLNPNNSAFQSSRHPPTPTPKPGSKVNGR